MGQGEVGLSCGKALVGTGWAISLLLGTNRLKKTAFWPCWASISGSEAIFLLYRGNRWPRAVSVASSLDSECGLHHESAQEGCNGTCVKLEGRKLI